MVLDQLICNFSTFPRWDKDSFTKEEHYVMMYEPDSKQWRTLAPLFYRSRNTKEVNLYFLASLKDRLFCLPSAKSSSQGIFEYDFANDLWCPVVKPETTNRHDSFVNVQSFIALH